MVWCDAMRGAELGLEHTEKNEQEEKDDWKAHAHSPLNQVRDIVQKAIPHCWCCLFLSFSAHCAKLAKFTTTILEISRLPNSQFRSKINFSLSFLLLANKLGL